MENQRLDELIEKYILKIASREEQEELLTWYDAQNDQEIFWSSDQLNEEVLVKRRLLAKINGRIGPKVKTISLWPQPAPNWIRGFAAVAAAVTAITLGVWLYYSSDTLRHSGVGRNPGLAIQNDIAPGKNTATITFDNGEVIALNDEELDISSETGEPLKEGGEVSPETPQSLASRVARSKNVVLSTPRGGTYKAVLPDGSRVWLNADSKISFPSQFDRKQRKILLEGEAYFEVAKNKAKPFIVETEGGGSRPGQRVEVLGTHFNINSYADEGATKTTLLEGAVRVSYRTGPPVQAKGLTQDLRGSSGDRSTADQQMVTLKPGQQARLKDGALKVKEVDPETAVAWVNNKYIIDDQTIEQIMRTLARWYDVEVVYEGDVKHKQFAGTLARKENISKLLDKISYTGGVHFKIEGRRVTVMP